jgi:hypothetical protein
MTVKKIVFTLFFLLTTGFVVTAQNYIQSAGLRMGAAGGISYRRTLGSGASAEAMIASQNHGTVLILLFEKQKPALLFDDLNLNFIYGGGIHAGGASRHDHDRDYIDHGYPFPNYTTLQLGVDGFAAFEYILPKYPVALSVECKPYFELFDDQWLSIHLPVIAFGARYTF